MYCLIYKQILLQFMEPPPTSLNRIPFNTRSRGVLQVSMQHLCFLTLSLPLKCYHRQTAFHLSKSTIFLPLQLPIKIVS